MHLTTRHLIVLIIATLSMVGARAEAQHKHGHHNFAKDIDAFHSALAPLWHSAAGKERTRTVCVEAAKLEKLAGEIRTGNGAALLASVVALKQRCKTNPDDVDGSLAKVHDEFHHLAVPQGH